MASNTLLLVSYDSDTNSEAVRNALSDAQYGLSLALVPASEAVAHFEKLRKTDRSQWPQLILLDMYREEESIPDLLQSLKNDAALNYIPVLVMGPADIQQPYINHCYNALANAYVARKEDMTALKASVSAICSYWLQTVRLPY